MDIAGKKVAVLVSNYFEEAEFEEPIEALQTAGAKVTVISADTKELHGLRHIEMGSAFSADLLLREASSGEYDALLLPGGAINADRLRMSREAQEWVREFMQTGKPLAAICHAPWALISADVIGGKQLTSYYTIQDDVRNAGGEWLDQQVVIDENLITSRQPDDIPAFKMRLSVCCMAGR